MTEKKTAKKVGYMRISTNKKAKSSDARDKPQTFDLQHDALIADGVHPDDIYSDKASGKKTDRPQLEACIKALRPGDTLVVWKLDRLGRDTVHLIKTVIDLDKKGIIFRTLTGFQIDTSVPVTGKFTLHLFAALAEMEADQTHERVMAGLAAARARGRIGGRPASLTANKLRYAQAAMKNRETSIPELCKELKIGKSTLYNHVTPEGELTGRGEKLLGKAA
jgi:DNA invertase Pin-like site-specific DNA recombinase